MQRSNNYTAEAANILHRDLQHYACRRFVSSEGEVFENISTKQNRLYILFFAVCLINKLF